MKYSKSLVILLLPFLQHSVAQSLEWTGFGKGLTYMKISNGEVIYSSYNDADARWAQIIRMNNEYIYLDSFGIQKIEILSPTLDSLKMKISGEDIVFCKPEHVTYYYKDTHKRWLNFRLNKFRLDYLNNYSSFEYRIEFNRYGMLRFSNRKNETLFEDFIGVEAVDKFDEIIKLIDIRNLNESRGRTTNCDDKEYKFVFEDYWHREYKYRAIRVPIQLIPVKRYFEEILKSKGIIIKLPNRD